VSFESVFRAGIHRPEDLAAAVTAAQACLLGPAVAAKRAVQHSSSLGHGGGGSPAVGGPDSMSLMAAAAAAAAAAAGGAAPGVAAGGACVGGLKFSRDVVVVEVAGAPVDLTLIDLPGIIQNVERPDDEHYKLLVAELAARYMRRPGTIIVAIITCTADIDTQARGGRGACRVVIALAAQWAAADPSKVLTAWRCVRTPAVCRSLLAARGAGCAEHGAGGRPPGRAHTWRADKAGPGRGGLPRPVAAGAAGQQVGCCCCAGPRGTQGHPYVSSTRSCTHTHMRSCTRYPLQLGWFVVKNPNQAALLRGTSGLTARQQEEAFFCEGAPGPWARLPADQRARLGAEWRLGRRELAGVGRHSSSRQ
jgi:hypothetical protein